MTLILDNNSNKCFFVKVRAHNKVQERYLEK